MALTIQHWIKTQEAEEVIDSQVIFCIGGVLWQPYGRTPFKVDENQLTSEELDAVRDIDQTLHRVWKNRSDRIVSRISRKNKEYSKLRAILRDEKNKIREGIKGDKELGITANSDDLREIEEIDKRMSRLRDLAQDGEAEIATLRTEQPKVEAQPAAEEPAAPAEQLICPDCMAKSPPGHANPDKWVRGHRMQCKARKERKAS